MWVFIGIVVFVSWLLLRAQGKREAAHRARLVGLYGEEAARRILAKEVWQGETAPMLAESLGRPDEVKEKVMKATVRRTLCFQPIAKNRYRLRVHLENDVVVGWEA